jgi:16S rRNA C967 or C1407 C5-methylase (RsmB/RsmF family)/NOL1/NOP2/fmu family ribosome biogenesis protein
MEFPKAFIERLQHQLGSEAEDFFSSLSAPPSVSVRLNRDKQAEISGIPVPWCSDGILLRSRPSFTLDPLFHAGCYYVQEASSMFLEQVIKHIDFDERNIVALDACAAPGGKTTHLSSLLKNGIVVSNETIGSRVPVLKENVIKWGLGNIVITNSDTSAFASLVGIFDLILIDAPCSGEGLFRKDEDAVDEWSEQNCSLCAGRQRRILSNLIPSLKEEGILIYCTCTYNPEENERNIQWLCNEHQMECISIPLDRNWGIKEMRSKNVIAYSFYPHRLSGEGFFISALRKGNGSGSISYKKGKNTYSALSGHSVESWIQAREGYRLYKRGDDIYLLPTEGSQLMELLEEKTRIHYGGTLVGKIKHSNIIPSHEMAMSIQVDTSAFPILNLNKTEAISYLRKEDFKIKDAEKGWLLVLYEGHPLGWINNLGNRFNNYYPTDWRIRMKG